MHKVRVFGDEDTQQLLFYKLVRLIQVTDNASCGGLLSSDYYRMSWLE